MKSKFYLLIVLSFISLVFENCVSSRATPYRGYVYSNKKPEPGYGAYGYVLLTSTHATLTTAHYRRSLKTANSFLENFPSTGKKISMEERKNHMVTHWMLVDHKRIIEKDTMLLKNYDYARALSILTAIKMSGKQGPVLVAWKKPYEELGNEDGKKFLVFDLSRFSDDDIDRAFKLWRKMLSEDVDDWNRSGNKLIKFREEVRNSFQQYGYILIDLISLY